MGCSRTCRVHLLLNNPKKKVLWHPGVVENLDESSRRVFPVGAILSQLRRKQKILFLHQFQEGGVVPPWKDPILLKGLIHQRKKQRQRNQRLDREKLSSAKKEANRKIEIKANGSAGFIDPGGIVLREVAKCLEEILSLWDIRVHPRLVVGQHYEGNQRERRRKLTKRVGLMKKKRKEKKQESNNSCWISENVFS